MDSSVGLLPEAVVASVEGKSVTWEDVKDAARGCCSDCTGAARAYDVVAFLVGQYDLTREGQEILRRALIPYATSALETHPDLARVNGGQGFMSSMLYAGQGQ